MLLSKSCHTAQNFCVEDTEQWWCDNLQRRNEETYRRTCSNATFSTMSLTWNPWELSLSPRSRKSASNTLNYGTDLFSFLFYIYVFVCYSISVYRQSKLNWVATGMWRRYLNTYVDFWRTVVMDLLNYVPVSSCMWMVNALWQTLQQMMVSGIVCVLCGILQMGNGAFILMQNLAIMEQVLQVEHLFQVMESTENCI